MFETHDADVKLANVNMRAEIHGEEKKTAIDIKIEAQHANTVLDYFDPSLRRTLYQRSGGDGQDDLVDKNHMPQLRFPQIKVLNWATVLEGYTARVYSEFESLDVTLAEAKVDKFQFEPRDNGVVVVSYRIRCIPTKDQIGSLSQQLQGDVKLTLSPPKSDGSGAARIKSEADRKKQAADGQPDILDKAAQDAAEEQSEKDRATAILTAMEGQDGAIAGGQDEGQATTGVQATTIRYLDPPPVQGDDTPESELLVELLAERGFIITVEQIEDENLIIEDDFSDILAYLRGSPVVPVVLNQYKPAPAIEEKAKTEEPKAEKPKRERKKRGAVE